MLSPNRYRFHKGVTHHKRQVHWVPRRINRIYLLQCSIAALVRLEHALRSIGELNTDLPNHLLKLHSRKCCRVKRFSLHLPFILEFYRLHRSIALRESANPCLPEITESNSKTYEAYTRTVRNCAGFRHGKAIALTHIQRQRSVSPPHLLS
jgi:hypothetical protein